MEALHLRPFSPGRVPGARIDHLAIGRIQPQRHRLAAHAWPTPPRVGEADPAAALADQAVPAPSRRRWFDGRPVEAPSPAPGRRVAPSGRRSGGRPAGVAPGTPWRARGGRVQGRDVGIEAGLGGRQAGEAGPEDAVQRRCRARWRRGLSPGGRIGTTAIPSPATAARAGWGAALRLAEERHRALTHSAWGRPQRAKQPRKASSKPSSGTPFGAPRPREQLGADDQPGGGGPDARQPDQAPRPLDPQAVLAVDLPSGRAGRRPPGRRGRGRAGPAAAGRPAGRGPRRADVRGRPGAARPGRGRG